MTPTTAAARIDVPPPARNAADSFVRTSRSDVSAVWQIGRRVCATAARSLGAAWGWMPLTPFGLAAMAAAWYFGRRQSDLIIAAVCVSGGICGLLNAAQVLVTGVWLRMKRLPATTTLLELESETACPGEFRLGLFGWNPLILCHVRCVDPPGLEVQPFEARGGFQERIIARERCSARRIVREFSISDLFGMARVRFRRTTERPVRCLSWTGSDPVYSLVEQFRPGDATGHPEGEPVGDLIEMRRYVPGDPLKLVLWKVFARTGRMLVRTPERSVSPTNRTLVHLVAGVGDEPSAGLVRGALEKGLLGSEAMFLAEGAVEPAQSQAEALEQIIASREFRETGGTSLEEFLVQGETKGVSSAWLFVPSRRGAWLDRVCTTLERHRGPFSVVIGTDGSPRGSAAAWQRWVRRASANDAGSAEELRHICDRLRQAGASVRAVDRSTGHEVPISEGE